MKNLGMKTAIAALTVAFSGEAIAADWNVSVWGKRRAFTEHVEKLAELVAAKTNGEFTMNVSYGGLSKNRENLHAVYAHPAATEEMAQWNARLLMTSPMPQYNIVGTGDPRSTLADFEGMRVRATGGLGKAFAAVGSVPTSVTATEAYQAMESGVVDTVAFAQHAHLSYGTINRADWWTENLNPGTVNCPVVVNIDAYESLSDAHRAVLDESVDESIEFYLENYGKLLQRWDDVLAEKGVEKVTISDADLAAFRAKAADPIRAAWIADMEAQGIPGQELFDLVMTTLENTRKGN